MQDQDDPVTIAPGQVQSSTHLVWLEAVGLARRVSARHAWW